MTPGYRFGKGLVRPLGRSRKDYRTENTTSEDAPTIPALSIGDRREILSVMFLCVPPGRRKTHAKESGTVALTSRACGMYKDYTLPAPPANCRREIGSMPINIARMLTVERIIDVEGIVKDEAVSRLVDLLAASPEITDAAELRAKIFERERTFSTGLGAGMAIPHVKLTSIKDFTAAIARSRGGIPFDSIDGKPAHIMVMIGCNNSQSGEFLKLLARLVTKLKEQAIQERILSAPDAAEVHRIFTGPGGILA